MSSNQIRNIRLDAYLRTDVDKIVARVLRDLGSPDPPLRLDDVRELLRLDRAYYSSTDDSAAREVIHRLKLAGKQVIARPTLLKEAISKFNLRALWLPDRKRILIDDSLPDPKKRWSEAHEVGHTLIPWHKDTLFGDDKATLTPACHAQIEAEANYAAGRLIFLGERFANELDGQSTTIKALQTLQKRFGNSMTTTLWRAVEHSRVPMIGAISCHPKYRPPEFEDDNPLRYYIRSDGFEEMFGHIGEQELFANIDGYCGYKRSGPLGEAEVVLSDAAGQAHVFKFETFFNRYDALTIGLHVKRASRAVGF